MFQIENIVLNPNVSLHKYDNQIKHCDVLKPTLLSIFFYPTGTIHNQIHK